MRKSTSQTKVNKLFLGGVPNKDLLGTPGGDYMEDVIIDGKKYKYSIEDGVPTLLRYNETYKTWIKFKFVGKKDGYEELEKSIQHVLKNEYLKRLKNEISRGI